MKVWVEAGELVVKPGGLRPELRLELAGIDTWDMLYSALNGRYLAFHLGHETHYVTLPRLDEAAREALLATLTELTGRAPDVSLLEGERDNEHWLKVWEFFKTIGRYLRLFINPMADPRKPRK